MLADTAAPVETPGATVGQAPIKKEMETPAASLESLAQASAPLPPAAAGKPRLHLDFLDGLRALAALTVIADHALCVVWGNHNFIPTGHAYQLGFLLLMGHFSVTTFIMLSGFCLMLPVVTGSGVLKGGAKTFYMRRAKRILPPYYLALLVSLLLIATVIGQPTGSHWDTSIRVDAQGLWSHFLLVHNLIPNSFMQINNALWTVAVEWQIYFFFPLLVLLWERIGGAKATVAALLCALAGYLAIHHLSIWGASPPYYGIFAVGALAAGIAYHPAPLYQRMRERLPLVPLCLLMYGVAIVYCVHAGWESAFRHLVFPDFFIGVGAALLLIIASRPHNSLARRALSWKPLVFLGTYSFSIYLMHVPLQQLFWQYALRPLNLPYLPQFCALVLFGTPFILGMAYLFFLACERPFMNTKPKAVKL